MAGPKRLLVASTNPGKVAEISQLLTELSVEVVGLLGYPGFDVGPETHETFVGNASAKALEAARFAGCLALADDLGLEVLALDGRPGVRSARYGRDDAERISKLLAELEGVAGYGRAASFVCALALASPDGVLGTWEDTVEGIIAEAPRGHNGFGFDPVFVFHGSTFAELSANEKNAVSHRGKALRAFAADLPGILGRGG